MQNAASAGVGGQRGRWRRYSEERCEIAESVPACEARADRGSRHGLEDPVRMADTGDANPGLMRGAGSPSTRSSKGARGERDQEQEIGCVQTSKFQVQVRGLPTSAKSGRHGERGRVRAGEHTARARQGSGGEPALKCNSKIGASKVPFVNETRLPTRATGVRPLSNAPRSLRSNRRLVARVHS